MSVFTNDSLSLLKKNFPNLKFKINFPLSKITYFKIGGPAEVLVAVQTREELINLIKFCQDKSCKYTILGGASNVLISDDGVSGLVILAKHTKLEKTNCNEQGCEVLADTGLDMSALVKQTVNLGLTGLEQLVGVPGTLGGAVFNNSHYHDFLISRHIKEVEIVNKFGEVVWLDSSDCDFGYDLSRFQTTREVILRVKFFLKTGDPQTSKQLMRESTVYRMKTQPLGMPSSGCIFKNPSNQKNLQELFPQFSDQPRISAGFLIEQAGLKGASQGSIKISEQHASFMVNTNGGTAQDVLKLIDHVKEVVHKKFDVLLKEEVFWLE